MVQIDSYKPKFDECISFFKNEIQSLRTGRAAPSIVENVTIDAYGVKTPLLHLASISCPDPKTIVIQPWDKNLLKDIEKGLIASDVQINPVVDGALVRLVMPPLTEENRKKMVRSLSEKAEQARVSIRQLREKIRGEISSKTEEGEMSEDEKFKLFKQLDEIMQDYGAQIKQIAEEKEKEIMTI